MKNITTRTDKYIIIMIKTYNIVINANHQSYDFWYSLLLQSAQAYNHCCNHIITNNIPLNLKSIHESVYNTLRNNYQLLPAQSAIKTYKQALSSVRAWKANKTKNKDTDEWQIPQKHNLSIQLDKRLYSNLSKNGIALTGEVKNKRTTYTFSLYKQAEYMFDNYTTKDPTLFIRNNRLYLSVPFVVPDKPLQSETATVGVDLGVKRLFVTSDGYAFRDKTYLKHRREVRYLKTKLKEKGTKSAKRHLRKLNPREYNLSNDMCHRATNVLLNNCNGDILVLEDLTKIKKTTCKTANGFKRKRHNNMLSQVPFYKFKEVLSYKAPLYGKKVVTVSPQYTSQIDSRTNKRDGQRIGCRYYCLGGMVFDADWNAAVNIGKRYKQHPLSNDILPVDGGLLFLNGRYKSEYQTSETKCFGQAHVL